MNTLQDRVRGSQIDDTIGDAFGYPIEFIKAYMELHDVILHMADDLYRSEVTKM